MTKRINLWSCPRNLSTALMYSFAQRPDTLVVDEPLYGHYLRVSGVEHPGREDILAAMDTDGDRVVREVMLGDYARPVVFFKQMTHHLVQLDDRFLNQMRHVIYIRDPARIISSYAKIHARPTIDDIGIQRQTALFRRLNILRLRPLVMDSRDLQRQPEAMLRALCTALDLDFVPGMLQWPAGPRPEDGPWARHWYASVHASTGFDPFEARAITLEGDLAELESTSRPYYSYLHAYRLIP